jgi:hypothetical protein
VDQNALTSHISNVMYSYHIQVPLCHTVRVTVTQAAVYPAITAGMSKRCNEEPTDSSPYVSLTEQSQLSYRTEPL